eukprot:m.105105 g.105105  ORF g.105105 m.105105 type:complete len:66 (+) comp37217_c0_seq7:204-401(+)
MSEENVKVAVRVRPFISFLPEMFVVLSVHLILLQLIGGEGMAKKERASVRFISHKAQMHCQSNGG